MKLLLESLLPLRPSTHFVLLFEAVFLGCNQLKFKVTGIRVSVVVA